MTTPCIVLAGGLGTRLRSVVPDLPKCLAPVGGHPFLEWQLRSLAQRGVDRFVLALGYGAYQVRESLNHGWASDFLIDCVIEREALGTGGATQFTMAEAGLSEALVINGDTYLGGDLASMLDPIDSASGERMRIATVRVDDRSRFGGVAVDAEDRVTAFLEKGESGAGVINAGLYRVHHSAFQEDLPATFSMETRVMPRLAAHRALQAREVAGPFIDIGVPEDYRLFAENIARYV